MESEVFKFICANSGALTIEDLVNVGSSDCWQAISNQERFVLCGGGRGVQPQMVVGRTGLRMCRVPSCPGTCQGLHLCKSILFGASCPFSNRRRGCNFSHELDIEHNKRVLREHQLEGLSQAELRTLLLQNDNTLLPPICFDYNNADGEFGRCQSRDGCERLHVCLHHLRGSCSCTKAHSFNCPQPLRILTAKDVPEDLILSLKSVYRNKMALRQVERAAGNPQHRSSDSAATDLNWSKGSGGGGGFRGNRGNRGNRRSRGPRGGGGTRGGRGGRGGDERFQRSISTDDLDNLDLYTEDGLGEDSSQPSGDNGQRQKPNPHFTPAAARGRGGYRGRRGTPGHRGGRGGLLQQQRSSSISDLLFQEEAAVTPGKVAAGEASCSGGKGVGQCKNSTNDGNLLSFDKASPTGAGNLNKGPGPERDPTEICLDYIRGSCKNGDKCDQAHHNMPYRWEVRRAGGWVALPNNEAIEQAYCRPEDQVSRLTTQVVCFHSMTCSLNKVRRLSTCSSVEKPTDALSTKWMWYWADDGMKWNKFVASSGGALAAEMDSDALERRFQANNKDVVEFGLNYYSLNFQEMIQRNKSSGTQRQVRRRPCFVSAADVERARKPLEQKSLDFPDCWEKTMIPTTGYMLISLLQSSEEYRKTEALFHRTMSDFTIVSIQRIQNRELWESYQLQKIQMKTKNGGRSPREMKLFYGTENEHVHDLCTSSAAWWLSPRQGFYGDGSYFDRDARSSHSFTGDSVVRSMFVAQVLVGEFASGAHGYHQPPSRDSWSGNLYDSCVNDVTDPSTFVVFNTQQIYPTYVLTYRKLSPPAASSQEKSHPTPQKKDSCAIA